MPGGLVFTWFFWSLVFTCFFSSGLVFTWFFSSLVFTLFFSSQPDKKLNYSFFETRGRAFGRATNPAPPPIILNMVTAVRQVAAQRSPRLLFSIMKGDGALSISCVLVWGVLKFHVVPGMVQGGS